MEKEVELVFTEEVIRNGSDAFQLDYQHLKKLGGFENYVFSAKQGNREVILRFTHSSHRTLAEVKSELAWLEYLKSNGAPVCGPIVSASGNLVEAVVAKNTYFFVSLFEKAIGEPVKVDGESFTEKLFFEWGKATAILHKISKEYIEPEGIIKRPDLVDEYSNQFAPYLPDDKTIKDRVNSIISSVKELPKSNDRYRLIHSDIHSGNFHFDGKKISIFDFDDCSYHHIISDIAIPIYYCAWFKYKSYEERTKFINGEFLPRFLEGYNSELALDEKLLEEIPLFLKLRDCELYGVLYKKWDITALNDNQKALLAEIKDRIISDQPIVTVQI